MRYELIILAFIGVLGGLTGGLFGVGGSVVMIPALTEVLGPNQHLYQATCMIVNFFVAAPAVIQHLRAGAIEGAVVKRLMPLSAVAVALGVAISELPVFAGVGEAYLRGLFGLFLAGVCAYELWRGWAYIRGSEPLIAAASSTAAEPASHSGAYSWGKSAAIALPTGLIGGLLGVGGGLVAVPLQHRLLGVPMRKAIADSAGLILTTSLVGAVMKNAAFASEHGSFSQPLLIAAVLIPAAIVGSFLGSRWLYHVPLRLLKVGFFLLLLVAAARLVFGAARDAQFL